MSKEIDNSEQGPPKEVQQRPTSGDDESNEKLPRDDGDRCETPTSSEHKIPTVRSCPPTPRKQAQPVVPHKRKLHFFETTGRDEGVVSLQ
ncbi:hypothetical protein NL676_031141 [Syzygium grande]|nr:hypothetical protein NL676_031141 [Syzygium grande]